MFEIHACEDTGDHHIRNTRGIMGFKKNGKRGGDMSMKILIRKTIPLASDADIRGAGEVGRKLNELERRASCFSISSREY